MRKLLILVSLAALVIVSTGCKRNTGEDIYGTTAVVIETSAETQAETTMEEVSTEAEVQTEGTTSEEETTADTVSEDAYDAEAESTSLNEDEVEDVPVASAIDDPAFEASVLAYLDPIYYNVFFGYGDYVEGITEEDMIKFAISYIYQHEYNELKFDTTDFILYVPEKRVEALVEKYFDVRVSGHHSFVEEDVLYEDGYYLMPAVDTGWDEEISVEEASATGDFSYEIILKATLEDGKTHSRYKVSLEVRDEHYVLVGYRQLEVEEGLEAEMTTTSAE